MNYLDKNKLYFLGEIIEWYNEHSDYYTECKNIIKFISCCNGLPCNCVTVSNEHKFIKGYNNINDLIEYSTLEKYSEKALLAFSEIDKSKQELRKWLIKHKEVGFESYLIFLNRYFLFDVKNNVIIDHLNVKLDGTEEFISVNVKDFKNLIEFALLFQKINYQEKIFVD